MSIVRPLIAKIALFSAVIVTGCAAGDEPLGATADAVAWNGCPNAVPVTTANYAPPHAFPGPCFGPADPGQADYDGASAELVFECQRYCGQSYPECGAAAQLQNLTCIDRDIGHRWGALCICGF